MSMELVVVGNLWGEALLEMGWRDGMTGRQPDSDIVAGGDGRASELGLRLAYPRYVETILGGTRADMFRFAWK